MKKKMIVLIAFIYIASMLFCGDGVGKKFVEEKFPHLTYSDKAVSYTHLCMAGALAFWVLPCWLWL